MRAEARQPRFARESGVLVGWWRQEKFCVEIGLQEPQRKSLAARLEALQTSYQIEQTRLNEARDRQSRMMLDPALSRESVAAFNRDEVLAPSDRMQTLNFEARMLVRDALSRDQLEAIARAHPSFFTAKWFQRSAVPIHEGKVALQEE